MRFIGVHLAHDAGIVIFNAEGGLELFAQAERYAPRYKSSHDLSGIKKIFPRSLEISNDDIIVAVVDSCWRNGKLLSIESSCDRQLIKRVIAEPVIDKFQVFGRNPTWAISHHLAHVASSWCFRPDDHERLFLAYDGKGHDCDYNPRAFLVGLISNNGISTIETPTPIWSSAAISSILSKSSNGFSAGKAMGLAGYIQKYNKTWTEGDLLNFYFQSLYGQTLENEPRFNPKTITTEQCEFVAQFYKWIISKITEQVCDNIGRFANGKGVVLGGGTCLALEVNSEVARMTNGDVVFGPPINDSGLALGAAAWGFFHYNKRWPQLNTPALNTLVAPLPQYGPQTPKEIASFLANNHVVGVVRGNSEAGPRALGYRSLLASAQDFSNLKRVSETIKGRESFRPLAPIVTDREFDRFFIGPRGRYMQYKVSCNTTCEKELPAIVHKDKSTRPQVVRRADDPWLYELLEEYGKLAGVECLINTSLNKAGKPICHNFSDAQEDMAGLGVELISIGTEGA